MSVKSYALRYFCQNLQDTRTIYIQDTLDFGLPIQHWEKLVDGQNAGDIPFVFRSEAAFRQYCSVSWQDPVPESQICVITIHVDYDEQGNRH
jgi:hypothetical protein